ncbi:hypothetical protein [Streptomyces phaeoluteigriseus]
MDRAEELPHAVDAEGLLALAEGHHDRTARPLGTQEAACHLMKTYALEAPGRTVAEQDAQEALRIAAGHLALGRGRGSLGLSVPLVHAGGDGDHVLLHTWIEGDMADLAIFVGPAGRPGSLRPGRAGLAPCGWKAVPLAHERDAFARHALSGTGPLPGRTTAWSADTYAGAVR